MCQSGCFLVDACYALCYDCAQFHFEFSMNQASFPYLRNSISLRLLSAVAAELRMLLAVPLARRLFGCFAVFAISALLILPYVGYPRGLVFDETYYITHAQKYLNGVFFLQTHPPLGKLLIAAGERWLHPNAPANEFVNLEAITEPWPEGLDITGYRLVPSALGILNPVFVFIILVMILKHEIFALAISMFVAFDNALVLESRTALLDSALIFFLLASILTFVFLMRQRSQRFGPLLALSAVWGALAACAADVKLSGFAALVLATVYGLWLLRARRFRRLAAFALVFGGTFAATYLGIWEIHFAIARKLVPERTYGISEEHRRILEGIDQPNPVTRFVIQFKDATEYEISTGITKIPKLDLGNMGIGSPWYWWLVGGRTINYRNFKLNERERSLSTLIGNPVGWLVSLLGVVLGTGLVLIDLLFRFLPKGQRQWPYVFVLFYWAYLIPFMLAQRTTYLHHYLPPFIVGVILFGIVLWQAKMVSWTRKRDVLVVALMLLVFFFWVFKPLTYGEPLTLYQFQQRNFWPAWDLNCAGC